MTKEIIKEDKAMKVDKAVYTAFDGTQFESEEHCKEYENASKVVLNVKVQPMFKIITENELFDGWYGSEEFDIGVIKVTKQNYEDLRHWATLNDCHEKIKLDGDEEIHFTEDLIGQTVIFGLGYCWTSQSYDNVAFYGTTEQFKGFLVNHITEALSL